MTTPGYGWSGSRALIFYRREDVRSMPIKATWRRAAVEVLGRLAPGRLDRHRTFRTNSGLRYRVPINDVVGRLLYTHGAFEKVALDRVLEAFGSGPAPRMVDVGAHYGSFAIPAAARMGPHGRVLAFEPNPETRGILEGNIHLNGLGQRIQVLPYAALDRDTELSLEVVHVGNSGTAKLGGPQGRLKVPCRRLDDVPEVKALDHLDIVKLDVEGFELEAIAGMERTIERHRPVVVFEVNDDRVAGWLSARGYEVFAIGRDGRLAAYLSMGQHFLHGDTLNAVARPRVAALPRGGRR
jgi:FkbM family methyltransferase